MSKLILPMALAIIGALLGLCSAILISARQQRQNVVMKLLDQYLDVRKHVVEVVSDLTNISDREKVEATSREAFAKSVAKLFYMHYDFLPKPVLDSLILLNAALNHPEDGPYMIVKNAILPMPRAQVLHFVESCSVFRNATVNAALALSGENSVGRNNTVIKLHARSVLYTMNQFSSIDELLLLEKRIRKGAKT